MRSLVGKVLSGVPDFPVDPSDLCFVLFAVSGLASFASKQGLLEPDFPVPPVQPFFGDFRNLDFSEFGTPDGVVYSPVESFDACGRILFFQNFPEDGFRVGGFHAVFKVEAEEPSGAIFCDGDLVGSSTATVFGERDGSQFTCGNNQSVVFDLEVSTYECNRIVGIIFGSRRSPKLFWILPESVQALFERLLGRRVEIGGGFF